MNLNEALSCINPAVKSQKSYHLDRKDVPVKLNQNENPFDWPPEIKKEVAQFVIERPWNRYPPFIPEELNAMLGEYAGMPAESIISGNGSNEMLLVLMLALVKPGTPVILCQPTFTVYRFLVEGTGAACINVPLDDDLRFDVGAILNASESSPASPMILCSPNNPTGSVLDEADLRRILDKHKGFIIMDQAYIEFGGYNAIPLIALYANLIIIRTLSKAFAGAGLRVGYLAGQQSIIHEINKIKLPYNINFFSEFVARTALRHRNELSRGIAVIKDEREKLATFLSTLPLDVYPSAANFILVRTPDKQVVFDALLQDGILVRDVSSYPKLANCLRISIGTPDENKLLTASLSRFFYKG